MNTCPICHGSELLKYQYGNHLGHKAHVKDRIAFALLPILRIFHYKYYDRMCMKLLFSPLFQIIRCKGCGFGKYNRNMESALIRKYYDTVYWQAEGMSSDKWQQAHLYLDDPRANGQYRCVHKWVRQFSELNVLEIGAGSAFFSRLLRDKHPGEVHLNAIEPGNGWGSYYKSIGISLIATYFPFESSRKFQYIHTSHWFEHVSHVDIAIRRIKDLLVENGLLFIEVPNCNDAYYSLDIGDIPHIHFFTKKSLCLLLEKNGFKTLTVDAYGLTYPEEFKRRIDPNMVSIDLLREGGVSVKENIPRRNGHCLRALFQLSE